MNYAYNLFYEISDKIATAFSLKWSHVHELNDRTLSGYAFIRSKNYIAHILNLRVSLNPITKEAKYVLDCTDEKLYYNICAEFSSYFQYKPYILYPKYYIDRIPYDQASKYGDGY